MNNEVMYDQFSDDYDRFVNWGGRLALELPFLTSELASVKRAQEQTVSVLDAACGTGQHLIALAKRGFSCAGADISAKMIDVALKNAEIEKLDIPLKQAGFGQLSTAFENQKFDGLMCLGNSLPHILDEEGMIHTLADFKAVLRPGGKLIIQNRNFDSILKTHTRWMEPETYHEGVHTWVFVRFYDFDPDGKITFHIFVLNNQNKGSYQQRIISTRLWPFTHMELVNWLKIAGFNKIYLYGALQGSLFEPENSPNLVVTAAA